ncbi:hemolysin family protein [Streptomyces nitrosporeus]|uniref:HlyC/CorC family transporter n=1 Tax=Streptomyces nitrosporeus TaxID=28894 RepID=A0A5J6FHZ9_9ACTN|nr:hemolysin family protein [Streptomyces nitrosporeus]QEU75988.1 HlyC/CorC family transporter [Streptomyces nitrosporeus]GGZ24210.1 membrane protein [Streptomyces nitrosporeus]
MTAVQLLIGALTLLTNAFFVGAEFALISVRRSQIEPAALKGNARARSTLWGLEHLSAVMATAQLGITISSLVLGAVAEPAIAHLLEPPFHAVGVPEGLIHPIAFVIALTAATYLHMLIGEMVPKNIALAAPAPTALLLGPPLVALTRAMRPVIFGINAFANALLRLLKVEPKSEVAAVFTDDELVRLVKDSSDAGLLDPADGERLRDALELGTRPVGEVMVPLGRTVTVGHDITPARLERTAAASGFSRLPVTGPGGAILGYLHIKDALGTERRHEPFPSAALHPVIRVEIDTPLDDTMTAMRAGDTHLAAVTGEKGTVIGFVTMEDVLGELVGPSATV